MLILGEKYTFTPLEIERLKKKFSNISTVCYAEQDPSKVINNIKQILNSDRLTIIVLNTKAKVDDTIISFLTNLKYDKTYKHLKIYSIEHFLEKFLYKCYIPEDNTDLHYLDDIQPFTKWQYFQKRVVDYFGIFWLYLFSFFVVQKCKKKIQQESPGPIYFKQDRVGINNETFTCIKFRSMHEKTDYFNHYTQKDDPRIFPWGKVMRRRRYDELPQIKNILKADMHLIGPRAEWDQLVENYEKEIPYYNQRHVVRPGITGWAQVMYRYGSDMDDTRQKLMYDLYYIKYWSIFLELQIVWKTALVVLHRKGH